MQKCNFNKDALPQPATSLKKRPWHRCFPMNVFTEDLFFTEYLWTTVSENYTEAYSKL